MNDEDKTKEQLIKELRIFRSHIAESEHSKAKLKQTKEVNTVIPEKKKVPEKLVHEYELLNILMDNIPDSIYFKDEKSGFVKVNRAKAEHSKTRPEDMIGKTDFDFLPKEQAMKAFLDDKQVMKSGRPLKDTVEKLTHKDGTEVWISATKIPWYDKKGNIIGTIGISRDITKRRKNVEALKESRKRFSIICASVQDAIIILNNQGEITYWNAAAQKTFSYTAQEVMNKDLLSFLVPQRYQEAFKRGFASFKKTGQGSIVGKTYEVQATKKDRTEFPIELSVSAVKLKDKWNAIGIVRDITGRKTAENKLEHDYHIQSAISSILRISMEPISLEEQLRRTLNLILSIPWLSLQSKGCIFLLEDEPDALVMKVQRGLAEPLLTACTKVPFGRCLCGRAASTCEIQFSDHVDDRHETHYQGMLPHGHYNVPITSGDRVLGVINLYVRKGHKREKREEEFLSAVANTLAGIIERKQSEEELKNYRDHLEELVKERTNELSEAVENLKNEIKERRQAQEALNEQRERFISVLIHDLKGPLVPIIGYIKRLINGKAKTIEDTMRILKIAEDASQNLLHIIESTSKDLRDKAALQSFSPKEVEFNDILLTILMNLTSEMESRGIEIFINEKGREKWNTLERISIEADPYQLGTLVDNLLGNAMKYAKSTIKVALHKIDPHVRFIVSDDGPGIPEKYHGKIFEEYYQVPGSKTGTGIGLFSVKKVVENHGGKIVVHSSLNTGTSFEIMLPLSDLKRFHEGNILNIR